MKLFIKEANGKAICRWCDINNNGTAISKYCYHKQLNKYSRSRAMIKAGTNMLCISVAGAGGVEAAYYCQSCAQDIIRDLKSFIKSYEDSFSLDKD